jgi:Xaa-Pro dipeptidase
MDRRKFLSTSVVAGAAALSPAAARASLQAENKAGAMSTRYPPLNGPFRLTQDWHKATTARFQKLLTANELAGAVVSSPDNINYLTGSFATSTERPIWLYIPAKGEPTIFYPGLDRELWQTWWVKDGEWYFDYHHHGPMGKVVYEPGPPVDLFAWMTNGIVKRGAGGKRIGYESRLSLGDEATAKKAGIIAEDATVAPLLLSMRQVKTAEELALAKVSIELHDRMLEFGRNYILQHGTDATDWEVSHATRGYGAQELMRAMGSTIDGKAHNAVGILVDFECRAGVATAYPHPNQFYYHKIQRGDAVQIATSGRVGGYGGEGYRGLQIEGPGVTDLHHKLWDTHHAMTLKQQELQKAGAVCSHVGAAVLKLARDAGLEKYVFHRPAHGEGAEGHQAPYLSLGDTMVLREGMCFSNEPGLYSVADGFGYNNSNFVVVRKDRGEMFNRTPLDKEWCWIKL